MNFTDKKVSIKQAMEILAHHGIHLDEDEADVILDFLYLMSKNYKETKDDENAGALTGNRTPQKIHQT